MLEKANDLLRVEIEGLKQQLLSARGSTELTMREQTRCPGCGCADLLHAPKILDNGREALSVANPSAWFDRRIGEFQVFICSQCGLVEWYVKDPQTIEPDGQHFFALHGVREGEDGPYR